jgi:CDP-paratose 2-epimerase
VGSDPETRAGDVRIYLSDCRALRRWTDWSPRRAQRQVLSDIFMWIHDNERLVAGSLGA